MQQQKQQTRKMSSKSAGATKLTDVSQSVPWHDVGESTNPEGSLLEELQRITQQVTELETALEKHGNSQVLEGVETGRLTSEMARLRNAVADVDADRRARERETQQLRATVSACDAEIKALRCSHLRTTRAYEEAVRREAEERVAHAATFDQLAALRAEWQEKLPGECCIDLPSSARGCRPSSAAANREVARLTIENSVLKARVAAMEAEAEQSEDSSSDAKRQQHAPADELFHSESAVASTIACSLSSTGGRGPLSVRVKEVAAQEADDPGCGAMDASKKPLLQASASSLGTDVLVSIRSEATLLGCSDSAIHMLGSPDGEGNTTFSRNTSVATVAPITSATEPRDATAFQQQPLQLRIRPSVVVTPPVVAAPTAALAPPTVKPVHQEILSARRLMCPSPRSTPALHHTLRYTDDPMYRSGEATPSASTPALNVPVADSQRETGESQRRVAR